MLRFGALAVLSALPLAFAASQTYSWANVVTGGGGGFVPNIVFNPSVKGLAYARTDIGGAYRLNSDGETWTPLMDWVNNTNWNMLGCDALATDPVDTDRVYVVSTFLFQCAMTLIERA
jgi:xyloglucan-specific exo-beta-1,4-glucanase